MTLHINMPFQVYKDLDAINNSQLKAYRKRPRLFKKLYVDRSIADKEETESMRQGSLTHTMILEPDAVNVRYLIAPEEVDRRYKEGKEKWKAWTAEAEEAGKKLIPADDYALCKELVAAAQENPEVAPLFTPGAGMAEFSVVSVLEGVPVKGRPDFYSRDGDIYDVKTCEDFATFERDKWRMGYYAQMSWYRTLLRLEGLPVRDCLLVPIEKSEPHGCEVHVIDQDYLDRGEEQNLSTLKDIISSMRTGTWPSARAGRVKTAMPDWLVRELSGASLT